jgi:GntR family transcriptional regulator
MSKGPVYQAIADAIRKDISRRRLAPHTRLASEPELARLHGAARETVRRALATLAEEGVIYRRRASGSFVAEPRVDQTLDQLFSFSEFMVYRGLEPGTRLLQSETTRIDDPESEALHYLKLKPGSRVIHLRRLRTGSGEPLVIASTWLPEALFRGFLGHDLTQHSVYEIMSRMGRKPTDAVQTIVAVTLDQEQAALLGVAPGAPALLIRRVGYASGVPVEYAVDYYRGDRTTFRVRLGVLEQRFAGKIQSDHIAV